MTYWDTGTGYVGVDDGTNTTDILRFWDSGSPYTFVFPTSAGGSSQIKTINELTISSDKNINELSISSVKTINELTNI